MEIPRFVTYAAIGLALTAVAQAEPETEKSPPYQTEQQWVACQVTRFLGGFADVTEGKIVPTEVSFENAEGKISVKAERGGKSVKWSLECVWDPAQYEEWARLMLPKADESEPPTSTAKYAAELLEPSLTTFLNYDRRVSLFLRKHPGSAQGHLQAALLMGTLALNEYANDFTDTRPALNRMTAHLAAARVLGVLGDDEKDASWQLAELMRLTLIGQCAEAVKRLEAFEPDGDFNKTFATWRRVLLMRCTMDWRIAEGEVRSKALAEWSRVLQKLDEWRASHKMETLDIVEEGKPTFPAALRYEFFRSLLFAADDKEATELLRDICDRPQEYCRIANERKLSVSQGHVFAKNAPRIELMEIAEAMREFGYVLGKQSGYLETTDTGRSSFSLSSPNEHQEYLDTSDDSQVSVGADGKLEFRVAGKSFFAGWQQRRLMGAFHRQYSFLHDLWGVKDRAKEMKDWIENELPEMRYKPFLRRIIAHGLEECEKMNVACKKIVKQSPSMITPRLWMSMTYDNKMATQRLSVPNMRGWFTPTIPQGTAFDIGRRSKDLSMGKDLGWWREVWERNPYDYSFSFTCACVENGGKMENVQTETILKWMGKIAGYHSAAAERLAVTYTDDPEKYEAAMGKIAERIPDNYLDMAKYFANRKMDEKAAKYYLLAFEHARDRVSMANNAQWIVEYLYHAGDKAKALEIAKDAAEVYSYRGLRTYLRLMEHEKNWTEVLDTARKIDKRYNDGEPAEEASFLFRMHEIEPEEAKQLGFDAKMKAVFPKGMQKVVLSDFSGKPTQGTAFVGSSASLRNAGLGRDIVVVALDGYRTDTVAQYLFLRSLTDDPKMSLIVWDGEQYLAKELEVPMRRFGVDMKDYNQQGNAVRLAAVHKAYGHKL